MLSTSLRCQPLRYYTKGLKQYFEITWRCLKESELNSALFIQTRRVYDAKVNNCPVKYKDHSASLSKNKLKKMFWFHWRQHTSLWIAYCRGHFQTILCLISMTTDYIWFKLIVVKVFELEQQLSSENITGFVSSHCSTSGEPQRQLIVNDSRSDVTLLGSN